MMFKRREDSHNSMWINLNESNQVRNSEKEYKLIFKHSTRCGISRTALKRFEEEWIKSDNCELFYLDLLSHRETSNSIAKESKVKHESPQVILLMNEEVVYHASHASINSKIILELINKNK